METKKQKVKCSYKDCGYEWETKSKLRFISCPSCLRKVRIEEVKKTKQTKSEKKEVIHNG